MNERMNDRYDDVILGLSVVEDLDNVNPGFLCKKTSTPVKRDDIERLSCSRQQLDIFT